jgi:hypothetical protein
LLTPRANQPEPEDVIPALEECLFVGQLAIITRKREKVPFLLERRVQLSF